jgi:hypothetical protein
MALNKQIHSFLTISETFLKHAGEWPNRASFLADPAVETGDKTATRHPHGNVCGECRKPIHQAT